MYVLMCTNRLISALLVMDLLDWQNVNMIMITVYSLNSNYDLGLHGTVGM